MPELPEVEVIARRLRDGAGGFSPLVGRTIASVRVPSKLVLRNISALRARARLAGAQVRGVRRRAKHIVLDTYRDGVAGALVLHLRMTGDLNLVPTDALLPRFTRLALDLNGGWTLAFTDRRHLGTAHVVDDASPLLAGLGPEPLDRAFDVDALAARLKGARPIKATLLDQRVIAGIGNIYADEALFRARLAPTRRTSSLSRGEIEELHVAIRAALTDSIDSLLGQGTRIAWRYLNRASASPFLVYGRGGEPCLRCGSVLAVLRVAGRTTVACPTCQSFRVSRRSPGGRAHGTVRPASARARTRGSAKGAAPDRA